MTITERKQTIIEDLRTAKERKLQLHQELENLNTSIERLTGAIIVLGQIEQEEQARQPADTAQGVSVA